MSSNNDEPISRKKNQNGLIVITGDIVQMTKFHRSLLSCYAISWTTFGNLNLFLSGINRFCYKLKLS